MKSIFATKKKKSLPFNTKKEDDKLSEYLDVKTHLLQKQFEHQNEKLQIEQQRIQFDERRLQLEEKTFEGNLKMDIAKHNMNMLKMRKEAKEIDPNLKQSDLDEMFPFRT